MRRLLFVWTVLCLMIVGALIPSTSVAQTGRRCFDVPGITSCIEGRFREYWEQNGGLPVFGYPITAATSEQTAEGTFLTQYFERNRFELHPEKQRPYDVLLGRLGDDRLKQLGRTWQAEPHPSRPDEFCAWFPQTNHQLCDQEPGYPDIGDAPASGFKTYWTSHGLEFDGQPGFSEAESLALFGYPVTEARMETNANGDRVETQWFERARFEWHPNNPGEYRVLLGLLGNETREAASATLTIVGEPTVVSYTYTLGNDTYGVRAKVALKVKNNSLTLTAEDVPYRVTITAGGRTLTVSDGEDELDVPPGETRIEVFDADDLPNNVRPEKAEVRLYGDASMFRRGRMTPDQAAYQVRTEPINCNTVYVACELLGELTWKGSEARQVYQVHTIVHQGNDVNGPVIAAGWHAYNGERFNPEQTRPFSISLVGFSQPKPGAGQELPPGPLTLEYYIESYPD